MPLQIRHVSEREAPRPTSTGRVNEDAQQIKSEMMKLGRGAVLEIEAGSERGVRGIKTLITRASNDLGNRWRHWHVGSKVFAKPDGRARRGPGRPRKN